MRDVALVEFERRHEELRQRHAALVAALDALVKRMENDGDEYVAHWALVLATELAKHREGR